MSVDHGKDSAIVPGEQRAGLRAESVRRVLEQHRRESRSEWPVEVQQALYLARRLCERAQQLQTPHERRQQAELRRMIESPRDKATLTQITDQAFRANRPERSADQLIHVLDVQGIPRFFGALDRTLLLGFRSFGAYLPGVAMPFVRDRMRHETANVILPAEPEHLRQHLRERQAEGLRMNVNYLGEALLGEAEAARRLSAYLVALQNPDIEVLSVKISTIYSQISAIARRHTIAVLCDRLEALFRESTKHTFQRQDGTSVEKMVYLDMEEYRDKEITAEAFMAALDRPGLARASAGIALQAYLPDSFPTLVRLAAWARRRVAQGGAPITIRLVKGANMEAERVEASLRGWPQAPFKAKVETDANYLRMLHEALRPENLPALRLGIATHNLFTASYALTLAVRRGCLQSVQFEMLEGMVNHQRRALFELVGDLLLYAPACRQEDFTSAIGYLIRRLDENSGCSNFLRYAFHIQPDSPEWNMLQEQFLEAFRACELVSDKPRRSQDRRRHGEPAAPGLAPSASAANSDGETSGAFNPPASTSAANFRNEPDTDWSLPHNGQWAESIVAQRRGLRGDRPAEIPLVIGNDEIFDDETAKPSWDPSCPGVVVARYCAANEAHIERAIDAARRDSEGWRRLSARQRHLILHQAADEIAANRGAVMVAMLAEGGKTLAESDPEVSEAVDFCRFYADCALDVDRLPGVNARGRGVIAVVSPWNFPFAIPCGGVAAALAAGNTVILKPASDTVYIAYILCQCFWRAGVPKTALQFAPCSGGTVGQRLATHDGVNAVVVTGGTATAAAMLAAKPTMHLFAETGGKNATIATALCDRDQVIKNVLHSAFSHSGQKCSATSLLILESEVYRDRQFRERLCDAACSLRVGSAWDPATRVGPLIHPPRGELQRALQQLETGERWALAPRLCVEGNPNLVSPAVKWGVQPNSFTHMTELFGPVLGVMEAASLDEAITLVNATGYGLTSGLESLDQREHELWLTGIRAGNLYINRPTTGAIVFRQPFGGQGKSSVGPGIKAGGPNYLAPLIEFGRADQANSSGGAASARAAPFKTGRISGLERFIAELAGGGLSSSHFSADDLRLVTNGVASYLHWANMEYLAVHDHFRLLGEDNLRRYLPVTPLRIRIAEEDTATDVVLRAAALWALEMRPIVSVSPPSGRNAAARAAHIVNWLQQAAEACGLGLETIGEDDRQVASAIRAGSLARLRYAAPDRVPEIIRTAAAEALQYVADAPISDHGRIELLWYLAEQSVSISYHRYGNPGERADEPRDVPL